MFWNVLNDCFKDGVLPGSVSGGPSLPFPAALPENSSGGEGSAGSDHGLLSSSKKEQVRGVSSITVTPAPLPVWMSIRAEDGSAPSNNTQGSTPVEKQEMFRYLIDDQFITITNGTNGNEYLSTFKYDNLMTIYYSDQAD